MKLNGMPISDNLTSHSHAFGSPWKALFSPYGSALLSHTRGHKVHHKKVAWNTIFCCRVKWIAKDTFHNIYNRSLGKVLIYLKNIMQLAAEYISLFALNARKLKCQILSSHSWNCVGSEHAFHFLLFLSFIFLHLSFTCTPSMFYFSLPHHECFWELPLSFVALIGVPDFGVSHLPLGFCPHLDRAPPPAASWDKSKWEFFGNLPYLKLSLSCPQIW